ncbi:MULTISPECIES: CBS domain-containing protein [Acidianus]|uniref:Histidine kinase n=1 Tax=Candidatus Acidianus copahuensis TaxID=1160895 RepID=A0A031LSX1_9CREN|nr:MULTISPECIES: CBS domain-containing protein [Acidianus]EZQ10860.1 histidine kinase [Candidatus Acidianus copahuensis]NON62004.1 CBS domain-containing protein [Acidianus sp. RZ1]
MEETIKEYMRTSVITVSSSMDIREAAKVMTESNVGSVIVIEGDKPKGIVTERDIVRAIGKGKGLNDKVDDIMTVSLITVREDSPVTAALSLMRNYNIRHLPVVDDQGKLKGIISIRDVAKALDNIYENSLY